MRQVDSMIEIQHIDLSLSRLVQAKQCLQSRDDAQGVALLESIAEQEAGAEAQAAVALLIRHYTESARFAEVDALRNSGHDGTAVALAYAESLLRRGDLTSSLLLLRETIESMFSDPNRAQERTVDNLSDAAHLLFSCGFYAEAVNFCRMALSVNPEAPQPHYIEACACLSQSQWLEGFGRYHWRHAFLRQNLSSSMPDVMDRLGALAPVMPGQRVLAVAEPGVDEELMFLRFAPWLAKRQVDVVWAPSDALKPVLERDGRWLLSHDAEPVPARVVAMGDLPALLPEALGPELPTAVRLQVDEQARSSMDERLAGLRGRMIGLTWRSSALSGAGRQTVEVPLTSLAPALKGLRATFVVLQKDATAEEWATLLAHKLALFDPALDSEDLEAALALHQCLHDYVTVDTAQVQLRAALGKSAHVLVPIPYDFRWPANIESPWFPQCRAYHATLADDPWSAPLRALKKRLRKAYR